MVTWNHSQSPSSSKQKQNLQLYIYTYIFYSEWSKYKLEHNSEFRIKFNSELKPPSNKWILKEFGLRIILFAWSFGSWWINTNHDHCLTLFWAFYMCSLIWSSQQSSKYMFGDFHVTDKETKAQNIKQPVQGPKMWWSEDLNACSWPYTTRPPTASVRVVSVLPAVRVSGEYLNPVETPHSLWLEFWA